MSILPQLTHRLGSALSDCLDALLPASSCLLCGTDSGDSPICPACRGELAGLPAAHCPQCAIPTTYGEHCGACLHTPPAFDRSHALWRYDFPTDRLIQALKYGHQTSLGAWFGEQLCTLFDFDQHAFDRIIPLPLHPARLRERGFNQAVEIARPIARRFARQLDTHSVIRERHTAPQASLDHQDRQSNIKHAFAATVDLKNEHILLIDDVMTSGATLDECARILKLHGARRVEVAVLARAVHHA